MFSKIDEDEALAVEKGVYKPVEVYAGPDGGLYIRAKGGFVRCKKDGSTSHVDVKLVSLHREGELYVDKFGRLCATPSKERASVVISAGTPEAPLQITKDKL